VRCGKCAASYPIEHGVIDLLSGGDGSGSLMQRAMEAETIVGIYESRGWRRSALAALAFGISFEQERQLILHTAAVTRGQTVLDLACGTGIYTRPFAAQARPGLVVGLDLSLPMLRLASRLRRKDKLHNIVLIHGTARRLPFPPEHFDVVNCGSALHLFPHAAPVLREVHRVLKPGGRFTASAARWESPLWVAAYSAAVLGIHPFSTAELGDRCRRIGFAEVRFHHASRLWLIMSARKPAHPASRVRR
jgi:ubiquinone/menaquinone biosynthesis C-methylase UbiE